MREWSRQEIQRIGYQVVDLIADHLSTLPGESVFVPVPPAVARQFLTTPAPLDGVSPDDVLRAFQETIEPYPFGNGHPRFWGSINSPPAVMGIFAEALAAAMNPSCAGGNHAAIHLEREVLEWFRELLRVPRGAIGLLGSGGAVAAPTAMGPSRPRESRRARPPGR